MPPAHPRNFPAPFPCSSVSLQSQSKLNISESQFPYLSLLEAPTSGVHVRRREHFCSPPRPPSTPHRGPLPRQAGSGPHPGTEAQFAGEEDAGSQDKLGPVERALPAPPEPSSLRGPPGARSRDSVLTVQPQPSPGPRGALTAPPGLCIGPVPARLLLCQHERPSRSRTDLCWGPRSLQQWTWRPQTVLGQPGPHAGRSSQWRPRSKEGPLGTLTPHACCAPGRSRPQPRLRAGG